MDELTDETWQEGLGSDDATEEAARRALEETSSYSVVERVMSRVIVAVLGVGGLFTVNVILWTLVRAEETMPWWAGALVGCSVIGLVTWLLHDDADWRI